MRTIAGAVLRNWFVDSVPIAQSTEIRAPKEDHSGTVLKRVSRTVLLLREGVQAANCRIFHQKHIHGPFSDEREAYFLCDVGHRIPCPELPASRPPVRARVWEMESHEADSAALPEPEAQQLTASSLALNEGRWPERV